MALFCLVLIHQEYLPLSVVIAVFVAFLFVVVLSRSNSENLR